jgi:hypothetical protein
MEENKQKVDDVLKIINECIRTNKLDFIANLIVTLQNDYTDLAKLTTDDNYQPNWTHKQTLDYLTYEQKF